MQHPEKLIIPRANYITISGQGSPEGSFFAECTQALFSVASCIQKATTLSFPIANLEARFWASNDVELVNIPRTQWKWKLLLQQQNDLTTKAFDTAKADAWAANKLPLIADVKLESWECGPCIQLLHTGHHSDIPASVEKIKAFMMQEKMEQKGHHQEIYLANGKTTLPEENKTIVRIRIK